MSGAPVVARMRGNGESSEADEFFEAGDAETVATIKELIETRVRPAVANDGGDITFRGYKDGVVYLAMKGACSGCPSSTATLKHGIQNLLRHFVPDVHRSAARSDRSARRRFAHRVSGTGLRIIQDHAPIADADARAAGHAHSCHRYRARRLRGRRARLAQRRDPGQRIARDGARPRRSADAADRARHGRRPLRIRAISTASPSPSGRAASPACASASRPRAASRSRPASPRSGSRRCRRSPRPHVAARPSDAIIAAIDARNEQVYFQVFAPERRHGRDAARSTACAPRCAPCRSGRP